MKIFRILLSAILLVVLTGCIKEETQQNEPIAEWLKTLPGVQSVQALKAVEYKHHYLVIFKQQLDHNNPAAGTFLQRVFVSHQDFARPVIFETDGYDTEYSMNGAVKNELSIRYKANMVIVEHRYSGRSLDPSYNWDYLTCENAAADLHAVRMALGTKYTGDWIATGASKGGTNSMSYTMYYPNDVAATVAYVGPICTGLEDTRFTDYMLNVGTPQMRKKIVDFQRELLIRRKVIQPIFFTEPAQPTKAKEYMTNDQMYENVVVDLMQGILQQGWDIDAIPETSATDNEIIEYLKKQHIFSSDDNKSAISRSEQTEQREHISVGKYLRELQKQSTKANDELDLSSIHYFVQTIIELGCYAYTTEHLEDLMPNHEAWSKNTITRFVVPANAADIQFSDKLNRQMNQWLQNSDPRLICVYGQYDPWTAAAPSKEYFTSKSNMAIFTQEGGSHSAKIEKLAPNDRQIAWEKLDKWVKH